jgi:hypothetical protein
LIIIRSLFAVTVVRTVATIGDADAYLHRLYLFSKSGRKQV